MSGILEDYEVAPISGKEGKEYIRKHHYSKSCHNGPMCWGLVRGGRLEGVCAFACPCSENVRASVFGKDHKNRVIELHRLHTTDDGPPNITSWFVARAIRGLEERRPLIRGIITYADATEGHIGTIYQSLNAIYAGTSSQAIFYRDQEGRLRHPRQCGVNITRAESLKRGWKPERRDAKHRYVILVGKPREKRIWRRRLLIPSLDYPKRPEWF